MSDNPASPSNARPQRADALTKIVATLGPASEGEECLAKMIEAGVSVFRLNFSHGTFEDHEKRLRAVRAVAARLRRAVAVLGDLQGPKIRVGKIADPGVVLEAGNDVVFVPGEGSEAKESGPPGSASRTVILPCAFERIGTDVLPGQRVLINDGAVRLLAVDHAPGDPPGSLRARVLVGGPVTSRKGINLPDSDVKASAITEQDWRCVEWAVAHGLDFLALSFVRRAEEVLELRRALAGMCPVDFSVEQTGAGAFIPVIAKIEKPQALAELDAIFEAADGVMVARGDLGVEMDLAQVPLVQKRLIAKADEWGKPCIVATQMLETMVTASTPTRAEAGDVATAVLEGADAVMLSAETATGRHPALVVDTMRRIAMAAEADVTERASKPSPSIRLAKTRYRTAALAHGAWHVAHDLGAAAVACWSQGGGSARYLSQTGLNVPILAYSSDERETRRMALLRAVFAVHSPLPDNGSLAAWNMQVEGDLLARGWVKQGDPIVLMGGKPLGQKGSPNMIAIHYVGNPLTGFMRHTM